MAIVQLNESIKVCLDIENPILLEKNVLTTVPYKVGMYIKNSSFYRGKVTYLDLGSADEVKVTDKNSVTQEINVSDPVMKIFDENQINSSNKTIRIEEPKPVTIIELDKIKEPVLDAEGLGQLMEKTSIFPKKVLKSKVSKGKAIKKGR